MHTCDEKMLKEIETKTWEHMTDSGFEELLQFSYLQVRTICFRGEKNDMWRPHRFRTRPQVSPLNSLLFQWLFVLGV